MPIIRVKYEIAISDALVDQETHRRAARSRAYTGSSATTAGAVPACGRPQFAQYLPPSTACVPHWVQYKLRLPIDLGQGIVSARQFREHTLSRTGADRMSISRRRWSPWLALLPVLSLAALNAAAGEPAEDLRRARFPEKFVRRTDSFDHRKREEMIPMRDGVKLKTFILMPKGANDAPMI